MVASKHEYTKNVEKNRLMNYLIEEQSQLTELKPLLEELGTSSGVVGVDTEFLREKTYNARLCLVQLGIGEHQYCIDVLAIEDLSPIISLFSDERVLKLFHAARQDMEVIYQTLEVLPKPIFDTQLAAAFCGADMQIGYGALVADRTGTELAKTQSRTDWTRRPLSAEQIKYAGEDVAYLKELYDRALVDLGAHGKMDWYTEEIEAYYELDKYVIDPAFAYKRLSAGNLKLKQQYRLRALAEWREETAQKRDIPRTWVLKDDKMFELATRPPKSAKEMHDMGVFGRKSANYLVPEALAVIKSVKAGEAVLWRKTEPLTKQERGVCSGMMKELAKLSESHDIAQGLLGTRRDMESLYRHRQSKKLLKGWRKGLVGKPMLDWLSADATG